VRKSQRAQSHQEISCEWIDKAAIVFAAAFYQALGFGHSVQKAFDSGKAALMLEHIPEENHKVLPLVDEALHTPDPHYTPPKVIFLNPDATEVLAKVEFEPDFVKRAHALADALDQVKGKMNSAPDAAKK
jgi:hypothetical protein